MKRKLINEIDRDMIIAYIKRLEIKKTYTVEIKQKRTIRSLPQNRLYWLWITCIEAETGNNRIDLHEYFKSMFLIDEKICIFNTEINVKTTTHLDAKKFTEYLEKIQIFASTELSITLPDPEDLRWGEFESYYTEKL